MCVCVCVYSIGNLMNLHRLRLNEQFEFYRSGILYIILCLLCSLHCTQVHFIL